MQINQIQAVRRISDEIEIQMIADLEDKDSPIECAQELYNNLKLIKGE